jgi:hypothetical protein
MKARTTLMAGLGAALALVAEPTRAAEPEPDALGKEPPADRAPWADITGRLRVGPDGLSLEMGGALVEVRISGDEIPGGEPPGGADPRARDFRATFSLDGKTTNLLLRFVPPPESAPPRER